MSAICIDCGECQVDCSQIATCFVTRRRTILTYHHGYAPVASSSLPRIWQFLNSPKNFLFNTPQRCPKQIHYCQISWRMIVSGPAMKMKILTIGKTSLKPTLALVEEYRKRIQPYRKLQIVTLKKISGLAQHLGPQSFLTVLEATGKMFSSEQLADWIAKHEMKGTKEICFLIGPGEGLPAEIKAKADLLLSLSSMTFQHELALVIFVEQLYRACTILKGEPYHK